MADQLTTENASLKWGFTGKQSYLPPKSPLFPFPAPTFPENNKTPFPVWSNPPYPSGSRKQHQRSPSTNFVPRAPPLWNDDLLNGNNDAPPKRTSHRRSSSDSVAFLDPPVNFDRIDEIMEDELECESVVSMQSRESQDFDRLDEEQLMSMFADIEQFRKPQNKCEAFMHGSMCYEKRVTTENLPAFSDHSSINEQSYEDKRSGGGAKSKSEPEVQSAENLQQPGKGEIVSATSQVDPNLDPKRAKRILANRQSAQRSRVRKLQYISELERSVNALQAEISALSSQVAYLDHQRVILNVDNSALQQRIAALAQDKLFKDAHYEGLKEELQRLRQLFQQQQQQHVPFNIQQQQLRKLELSALLQAENKPDAIEAPSDFPNSASIVTGGR